MTKFVRAVVVLALAAVAGTAGTAAPVAAAGPPLGAPRVTLIGDSTMAALRWYFWDDDDAGTAADNDIREVIANNYDLLFSAESCRRLVDVSCRGREGFTPSSTLALMRTDLRGKMGKVVVLMAGYDDVDLTASIGPVMDEAIAQGVEHVVWLTYRASTTYRLPDGTAAAHLYQQHNVELAAAAARYPQIRLLDWNGYTAAHPEWFAADDIHLNAAGAVALAQYIETDLDTLLLRGSCGAGGALTGTPSAPITTTGATAVPDVGVEASASGASGAEAAALGTTEATAVPDAGYVARRPVRVLDTRDPALGAAAGKLGAGRTVTVDVSAAVPVGTTAVVLTVTGVAPCAAGFLTVFACGVRPATSNINYELGRDTAGMIISALTAGTVCLSSFATTDVVVDVVGAFVPGGANFHRTEPTRWVDTRGGRAVLTDVVGIESTGADTRVRIAGINGIPADATAAWVNLTIADPTSATVLTAYPGPCATAPTASTVNARAARSSASSAIVGLGPDGSICVHTVAGTSGIVVDVAGWFGPGAGGLLYRPHSPTRLLDTRVGATSTPTGTVSFPLATTAVLNVTAAESTAPGYLTVRPCGSARTSSLVNTAARENTANLTAVGPDADGTVCISTYAPTHIVVDTSGDFV